MLHLESFRIQSNYPAIRVFGVPEPILFRHPWRSNKADARAGRNRNRYREGEICTVPKLTLQQILTGKPEPVNRSLQGRKSPNNPFLQANGHDPSGSESYGINQPLRHPMFVGYRDNKPIYAGSRLFVLY